MKAAGLYARLGWAVVPLHSVTDGACSCPRGAACPSAGKHPRLSDWVNEASADPAVIDEWATSWPHTNIGIATGHTFFCLDVDPGNGGVEALEALTAEHGALPATVQAQTGSGGSHYLFKMVPGITNSAGKVGPGLDIRGTGGQIVVAPSVSAKGAYSWVRSPFTTEIAEAPAWLLELIQRRDSAPDAPPTVDRGFFLPASPEVLQAARDALELHGPAIEGNGGDDHTFVAAALLVHDFALTDAEAWPLLVEWNDECQPPWGESDLRAKLAGGGKYGQARYGRSRGLDVVQSAQKLIADWAASGTGEPGLWPALKHIRHLALICGDPAKHAVILRDLKAATGFAAKQLGLPPADLTKATPAPSGAITVTTRVHQVADESIKAIAPEVFQRNGVLCEVVKAERTFISDLETARIQDLMSAASVYVRADGITTQAPIHVATVLHSRRTHPVRVLEAVTTAPVFLADGSILQTRGYNEQARVFLEPSVSVDVLEDPTREEAIGAVALFRGLVCDFKFSEPADFSSWLAGVLSPLVKAATGNAPAPLICVSACSPGAGKTLLTDVIARIVTGSAPEIRPYNPKDPGEWGKRLTSFVKAASPVSVFDNCNGPIGDEGLDRLITSGTWSDRILGASEAPPLPNVTTWLATGNNIEPVGDTVRRVLMVRVEVDTERPQERTDFQRPELAEYATANRADYLSAALTILRAYHVAGRPVQKLPSWGSFTTWSALVRGALVWAGCADPFLTQQRANLDLNEPENEAHDFWISVVEACDGLSGSIVTLANQRDARAVLGSREELTAFALKRFLGRFVDRPRAGKRIRRDRDQRRNQTRYIVEAI